MKNIIYISSLILFPFFAQAQMNILIEIKDPDINGAADFVNHVDWIEAIQLSGMIMWEHPDPAQNTSPQIGPIILYKNIDKASVFLYEASVNNTIFSNINIDMIYPAGAGFVIRNRIEMKGCRIVSYLKSSNFKDCNYELGGLGERIEIIPEIVSYKYHHYDISNVFLASYIYSWDFVSNMSF